MTKGAAFFVLPGALCSEDSKQTQPPSTSTWAVVILRGKEVDRLGTVEAPDQRKAYRLAIEQFNVPVER